MALLRVQLFGHFLATLDGVPLTALNTPRLQILFAYLLLNRAASQFRYHLACQLWPDSSEAQARTNLRNLIHLLRHALPNFDCFIRSDAQTLQWREDAPYTLDVMEFEQLLAVTPGKSPDRECLDRAVTLYQGDLLPSCYDDWITPERERLHRTFLASLEALAEMAESARDYPAALAYARRLLQVEPLHAVANRQLIRLYSLVGDRPAALKAYQAYAKGLEQELDIQPNQETQDLYAYLKSHEGQIHPPTTRPTQPVLVGRQTEWRRLQAAWRSAAAGNPQAVFVTGEAGMGKTRLVEELVQWAERLGIHTAVAHCYPAEGALPYAPVVSCLRSQALPKLEAVWLTELSRVLPEVSAAYPKLATPQPLTEAWQRLRLFEALARALVGNRRKLLVLIEDIHWCDQDTLEWLHFLLRYDERAPILVVVTERSDETEFFDGPIKRLRSALAISGKTSEIALKPLSEEESYQLAAQIALQGGNQILSPELAAYIYRETEGNPLFVVEMLRLEGALQSQEEMPVGPVMLPDKVQTILQWRINQLAPPTRELACLAAVIGREFRQDILQQASGVPEDELVKSLNELLQRKIVFEQAPGRYDFTHDKLRQALTAELSTAHRRLLHRRVADAYLSLSGDSRELKSAEIASHYERAGLVLPAIQYYRMASETAARIYSNDEAVRWLQQAIRLYEAAEAGKNNGGAPAQALAEMLVKLGDILVLTGQAASAQQAYARALGQAFDQEQVWRSMVYRKISETQKLQHQEAMAYGSLDRAEEILQTVAGSGSLEVKQEWINIQFARVQLMYWDHRRDEMGAILDEIRPQVEIQGGIDQQIELLNLEYQLRLLRENFRLSKRTIDLAQQKLQLCRAAGNAYHVSYTTFQLGFAFLWHNDVQSAQQVLAEALEQAKEVGARMVQARCLAYLSIATRKLGQVAGLRDQIQELLPLCVALGEYGYQGVAWANQGWLAWKENDVDRAYEFFQTALNCWRQSHERYPFSWLALWPLLAMAVKNQQLAEIETLVRCLLDAQLQPLLPPLPEWLNDGLQRIQAGDEAGALACYQQALEKAQELGDL